MSSTPGFLGNQRGREGDPGASAPILLPQLPDSFPELPGSSCLEALLGATVSPSFMVRVISAVKPLPSYALSPRKAEYLTHPPRHPVLHLYLPWEGASVCSSLYLAVNWPRSE